MSSNFWALQNKMVPVCGKQIVNLFQLLILLAQIRRLVTLNATQQKSAALWKAPSLKESIGRFSSPDNFELGIYVMAQTKQSYPVLHIFLIADVYHIQKNSCCHKRPFTYYVSNRGGGGSQPISDFFLTRGRGGVCQLLIFSQMFFLFLFLYFKHFYFIKNLKFLPERWDLPN